MPKFLANLSLSLFIFFLIIFPKKSFSYDVIEFKTPKTILADSISGQISLPLGVSQNWNGDVIIFIHPIFFSNRDTWFVDYVGYKDRSEFYWNVIGLLDSALTLENIAVVRFDNPGVYPPYMHCKERIQKNGLNNTVFKKNCFDYDVISSLTHDQYLRDIENLITTVRRKLPSAKNRILLMGFSEGGVHIAHLIDRNKFNLRGVIMISSPLESSKSLTKWQSVERLIKTIPEFDLNNDGVVTNEEITAAHGRGVGAYLPNLKSWLSPYGFWDVNNINELEKKFNTDYEMHLREVSDVPDNQVQLYSLNLDNGVQVPQHTNAFEKLHYLDKLSTFDVLIKSQIPALIIFGEKDKQIYIAEQLRLLDTEKTRNKNIQSVVFKNRFHGLSTEKDFQFFLPDFIPELSKVVSNFVKQIPK